MYGNRESWLHEYNQDASIENNKNRIKRCRGYIMRTLANANSLRGDVVADYISRFNMPNQQREVSRVTQFFNFLHAAASEPGEGLWHEWNQNSSITNAAEDVANLEAVIDPFFEHMRGVASVSEGVALGHALADFRRMVNPANPTSGTANFLGGLLSDAVFSGNSNENNTEEFFQNRGIRDVSNRLAGIEAKISVIDNVLQNAYSRAIHARDYNAAQFIAQIVPGLNPENQRLTNKMLDDGITHQDAELVRTAIGLGAQVNFAFNKDLPLLRAVQINNYAVLYALVVEGHADVNTYSKSTCCESFANFFRSLCCMKTRTTTLLHIAANNASASVAGLLYQHANDSVRAQIDGAGHTASYYCPGIDQVLLPAPRQQLPVNFVAVPAPNAQMFPQYAGVHAGAFDQAVPPPYFAANAAYEEYKFPQGDHQFVLRQRQAAFNPDAYPQQGF